MSLCRGLWDGLRADIKLSGIPSTSKDSRFVLREGRA